MVNVLRCELDEPLDRAGFRHAGATIGARIGAERIGASVYEAQAGHPIFPYHYTYAAEEWMYVLSGAPVLRDAGGQRALTSGDLACFPAGHLGAHVSGPGRLILFSADAPGPYVAVYPDSDKVAIWTGVADFGTMTLPRSAAVDYWSGEGSETSSERVTVVREPAAPGRPVVNALDVAADLRRADAPAGSRCREAALSSGLGAERLDATVVELDPGEGCAAYHYEYGRQKWLLVAPGTPTLRHPGGEGVLTAGDLTCFPEGPSGAQRVLNRSDEVARALFISTTGFPANVCYPDSGSWLLRNGPDATELTLPGPRPR